MATRTTDRKIKRDPRSQPFCATRRHHSTEAAEDYSELVSDLITELGEARTCEIAFRLGVSHVTALRTIRRLQHEGYLRTSPHQPITLTAKGIHTADQAKERHELLVNFLISLGVPHDVAEVDVEGAEHHISATTLKCIRAFMKKV